MDGCERSYPNDGTRQRMLLRLKREGRLAAFQRRVRELKKGTKAKEDRQAGWWQACAEFAEPLSPAPDDAASDDAAPDDALVDTQVFGGKSSPKPEVIGWVADNIGNDVSASDAPSPDAWHLLTWVRKAQSNEHTFWRVLYPLLARSERSAADHALDAETRDRFIEKVSRLAAKAMAPQIFEEEVRKLAGDPRRWKRLKREVDERISTRERRDEGATTTTQPQPQPQPNREVTA